MLDSFHGEPQKRLAELEAHAAELLDGRRVTLDGRELQVDPHRSPSDPLEARAAHVWGRLLTLRGRRFRVGVQLPGFTDSVSVSNVSGHVLAHLLAAAGVPLERAVDDLIAVTRNSDPRFVGRSWQVDDGGFVFADLQLEQQPRPRRHHR